MARGDSIPTRFGPEEDAMIRELQARSGLARSEIVRRAVRLLRQEVQRRGSIGFILDELAPAATRIAALVAEEPRVSYGKKQEKK